MSNKFLLKWLILQVPIAKALLQVHMANALTTHSRVASFLKRLPFLRRSLRCIHASIVRSTTLLEATKQKYLFADDIIKHVGLLSLTEVILKRSLIGNGAYGLDSSGSR
jgi:hypothetical protein